jgi:adhesin transport system outer membrane protein
VARPWPPAALPCWPPCAHPQANAACLDEDSLQPGWAEPATTTAATAPTDPRTTLQSLVRDALERSHAVGAANTLAAAALDDVEEAAAAKRIQASLSTGLGPGGSRSLAGSETSTLQLRASINVSQLLYDGGRVDRLADWRTQLAESAKFGAMTTSEQLALTTVSLALERSRYRQHVVVYGQYVRKMACLTEALEGIVRTDRGRASELVQARKSLQQAELAQAQAASQARQVDVRLRRLVGDGLPATEGMTTVLLQVPPLEQLLAEVETSSEIAGLSAQAQAMDRYAQAVAAGSKPQVSWIVSGSASTGNGSAGTTRNSTYSLGVAVNIPIAQPRPGTGHQCRPQTRAGGRTATCRSAGRTALPHRGSPRADPGQHGPRPPHRPGAARKRTGAQLHAAAVAATRPAQPVRRDGRGIRALQPARQLHQRPDRRPAVQRQPAVAGARRVAMAALNPTQPTPHP